MHGGVTLQNFGLEAFENTDPAVGRSRIINFGMDMDPY